MASSATSEATEIRRRGRQRLIGAIALVALLVVFVPMLLDSEPRPAREGPAMDLPAKDTAKPMPVPAPKAASTATSAAKPADSPKPPAKPADSPAKASDATATAPAAGTAANQLGKPPAAATATNPPAKPPAAATATTPPAKPPVATTTTNQPPKSGFAVQVGAFRDEAKLAQARERLTAAKVAHYTERLDAKGGGLTRLRAGPFETRESAEAALAAIRRSSLDGKVVQLP